MHTDSISKFAHRFYIKPFKENIDGTSVCCRVLQSMLPCISIALAKYIYSSTTVEPHLAEHPWKKALLFAQQGFCLFSEVPKARAIPEDFFIGLYRENVWDRPKSFI